MGRVVCGARVGQTWVAKTLGREPASLSFSLHLLVSYRSAVKSAVLQLSGVLLLAISLASLVARMCDSSLVYE